MPECPNTLSGLKAKHAELVRYRDQLEADIKAVTVDIDHLEAAIRIFDPEDTPAARRRYAAMHRAPKGQSTRFVLKALREASAPMTQSPCGGVGALIVASKPRKPRYRPSGSVWGPRSRP